MQDEHQAQQKSISDLEWPRVLDAIAERCAGDAGRALAHELSFASDRTEAQTRLGEVREAFRGLERAEPVPLHGVRDVAQALERLRVGASLGPSELRSIASTLGAARVLRRYLAARREAMPLLSRACSSDPSLDEVEDEINDAFDPDGTLSDHASPRLRELRGEHRTCRARLIARLEELMRKYAHVLSDTYWTEREGRYVLPVRTDAHERFQGLVHSSSASGHTLFVEPRILIPLGNRLKMLDGDVRREEDAIYAKLTALLVEKLPSVVGAVDALAHADLRAATARLARDASLVFIDVAEQPIAELRGARHPLLVLDGVEVVPSDLRVAAGRAVVISGPNAGGKTVALKSLGLAALMLRAGLPIACDEGSVMGLFDAVLTDVGDDQSLQRNLSTFSAHVQNLSRILDQASHGSLVLLDEVATGTDPREGEALAAAVLDSLCLRGAAVVCTTHYEGLKALALGDDRFENASVGFDMTTMSPTFRVTFGIPGASSALAVARRFGIPGLVLERAERFLSREDHDFEQQVQRLHDERRALELARAATEHARREAEAKARELASEVTKLRERGERALTKEAEALMSMVRRAREDLRNVQARLRTSKMTDRELREATRAVDDVAAKIAIGGELDRSAPVHEGRALALSELRRGMKVYVPRLRAEAEIIELLGSQLRVAAGALKLTVRLDEVRTPQPPEPVAATSKGAQKTALEATKQAPERALQTRDNTCDLRGLRADDAIRMAESFLDRSMGEGRSVAFLIHGHGTGALREAVRETLAQSSYVESVRPGSSSEGGDGVTVVSLR